MADFRFQEDTNLKSALAAVLVALAGILFLVGAENLDYVIRHEWLQVLTRTLGSLLVASVAIGFLWSLVARRALISEVMDAARLSEEVRSAGIVTVIDNFQSLDWAPYFDNVHNLDIFFAYGRTWRGVHAHQLQSLAASEEARVRIVLPDPEDAIAMEELARRFSRRKSQLIAEIEGAKEEFLELFEGRRAQFSLWFFPGSPVYSCYRLDGKLVFALYNHARERATVPTFVVEQGGSLYSFFRNEFDKFVAPQSGTARLVYSSE